MHVAQQDPLLARYQTRAHLAIGQMALFGAAEDEGAGIARVVNDLPRTTVQQLSPDEFALVRPASQSAREQEFLRMELLDHRQTGPGPLKSLEEQAHRGLHLGVGIQDDAILRVMNKADRDHLLELAAAGTAQDTAAKSCLEHMQFRFAHGALQAQQQAIVEVRRIVQPVLIEDERVGQRAQLKQPMPVGGVARQPRYFKTEHDPDATRD